jgi:hypothetical protein
VFNISLTSSSLLINKSYHECCWVGDSENPALLNRHA